MPVPKPLCTAMAAALLLLPGAGPVASQENIPPARPIPGINADDQFPRACVSCHVRIPDQNLDVRLSTLMRGWRTGVEPALLERVRGTAPAGMVLEGRHPSLPAEAFTDVPASCLECHGRNDPEGPPFARMLHAIHLQGGNDSHFLTVFQGECTHCHKLNRATGGWSIPSGPES